MTELSTKPAGQPPLYSCYLLMLDRLTPLITAYLGSESIVQAPGQCQLRVRGAVDCQQHTLVSLKGLEGGGGRAGRMGSPAGEWEGSRTLQMQLFIGECSTAVLPLEKCSTNVVLLMDAWGSVVLVRVQMVQ